VGSALENSNRVGSTVPTAADSHAQQNSRKSKEYKCLQYMRYWLIYKYWKTNRVLLEIRVQSTTDRDKVTTSQNSSFKVSLLHICRCCKFFG